MNRFATFAFLGMSVFLSGCGAAAITAIAASSGGSSSSGGRPNTAPSLTVSSLNGVQVQENQPISVSVSGNLVVGITVTDGEGDTCQVTAEISDNNGVDGSFRTVPASAVVSGNLDGLGASAGGTLFSFTLNTSDASLFPGQTISQAVLRFTVTDSNGSAGALPAISPSFLIANNDAPVVMLQTNADDSNDIAISFALSDTEASPNVGPRGIVVASSAQGAVAINSLTTLSQALPVRPGTLLVRFGATILRDIDNGDGTGRLVNLDGSDLTTGTASINYSSGAFSGTATVNVPVQGDVTADYNSSFLVVEAINYDNLRDPAGFLPCSPVIGADKVPFPVFVSPSANRTFIWDSVKDLDLGNSKFVAVQIRVNDGQTSTTIVGSSFLINNGPLGERTQLTGLGESSTIRLGDIDNDGDNDVLLSNSDESTFTIFINDGQRLINGVANQVPPPRTNPNDPNTNLVNAPANLTTPAGSIRPFYFELMDVNRDGNLDIITAGTNSAIDQNPSNREKIATPGVADNFFIFFGNGDGSFDFVNAWGPFRPGGFSVYSINEAQIDDDNGDGMINENDVSDLVLVAGFSHDPERVCSRQGLSKLDIAAGTEALDVAVNAGNPYTLTGNTLDNAPILPGSVQLVFDAATTPKIAVDRRIGPGLGVIIDLSNPTVPRCYIDYATGALLDNFPNAPLGALPGETAVNVDASAGAGYSQRLELTDNINAATFISTTLQEGDMISVSGFSWIGLSLNPDGTVNRTGIDSDTMAPIVYGTQAGQVDTIQELLDAVATLYGGSIPVSTDSVVASLNDEGRICFRIVANVAGTEPRFNTTADVNFSDAQGNTWPLFEDPHGRVTIYRGRAAGGFFSPNLSQEIINPANGQPLFPAPFFPATRAEVPPLLPESPDANGKATAPGPGTIDDIYALADLTGGMVQFPFAVTTASGALPLFPDPTNAPANGSMGLGAAGPGTFIGGFRPRTATVGKIFSVIPNVSADPFPDIVVANGGDASLTAMIQVPKANLIPLNPALGLFFQIFDFLDGGFVTQNLDVAGLINSQLAAAGQQSFFVQPSTFDFCRIRSGDIDGDGFTDLFGSAGQFFLTARNLLGTPNPPAVPFDVQLAVVGLNPGFPQIGDINRDGRKDIVVPVQATAEVAALINVPPVTELLATGTGAPITLNAQALTGFEVGRATPFPPSVTVTFDSGGVPHVIRREIPLSTTNFNLVLTRDPLNAQGMQADLGVVGGYNPLTFELTLSTGVNVDAELRATYDQFFTSNFTNNANLTNFKLIKFPTGFIPNDCIIADLNGDNLDDMVTVDTQPNSISVFFQVNESPLDNFINQPTGLGPLFLSKADVISGNGLTEVLVSNSASSSVSIFVPDPVLGLRLIQEVPLALPDPANPGQTLGGVPVPLLPFGGEGADLDGDGDDDYVVACSAVGGASGINQFAPGMPGTFSGGWTLIPGMSQAELDAGGRFASTTVGLGFSAPVDVSFADLNNDGMLDIVLGNNVSSILSFYINRGGQHPIFGGPNFGNLTTVPSLEPFLATPRGEPTQPGRIFVTRAGNPVQVSFTDLNNDGRRDMIFGVGDPREVPSGLASVGFMQGVDPSLNNNNNFAVETGLVPDAFRVNYIPVNNVTPGGSVSIAAADFNNDGLQDIAFGDLTTNAAAGICLNTTDIMNSPQNITFSVSPLAALGQPSALDVGDLNNDGFVDFVIPSQSDPVISIYLNDPNNPGTFGFPIIQRAPRGAVGLAILDLNNDGKLDVITVSRDTDTVNIFFQR